MATPLDSEITDMFFIWSTLKIKFVKIRYFISWTYESFKGPKYNRFLNIYKSGLDISLFFMEFEIKNKKIKKKIKKTNEDKESRFYEIQIRPLIVS